MTVDKYKDNWTDTKARFQSWWRREDAGRPLMRVVARRTEPLEPLETVPAPASPKENFLDVAINVGRLRNYCRSRKFLAESYPSLDLNIGPGSLATYLGAEPSFSWDTVWYNGCIHNWDEWGPLEYDEENPWWKFHREIIRRAVDESSGDFLVNIPDIIENVDILSAMRGPQNLCFDLYDEPETIKRYVRQVDDLYFRYYDAIYDIVKCGDGSSSYTAFHIWGPGKTAKVQCDFSAMMSPKHFREFVQPSLRKQCQSLTNSLYHLDGPDAIRHLDALMEIDELDALQWTSGAGQPDGGSEKWYPIYEKVIGAGKGLWVNIFDGSFEDWVEKAEKLVATFGSQGLYLLFPDMEERQAIRLIGIAEDKWSS
jgi:hypothetical protein